MSSHITSAILLLLFQAAAVGTDHSMAAERQGSQTADKVTRLAHVQLTSRGISDAYANAIARTVEAARTVAIEQFGFDMPDTIQVSAVASPTSETRLFNDGDWLIRAIVREAKE